MQFNFGAGIAAGAKAAADTYEKTSLEQQKADLENQKLILADQLAGTREEKMAGIKHGYDVDLQHEQTAGQKEVVGAEAAARTQSAKDIAQDAEDREQRLLKDPNYIAGLKRKEQAISSGNIAQVASANASNVQARATQMKLDAEQKIQNLQTALAGETDPDKRDDIQRKIVDYSTDANSIVATQTAAQAEYKNDVQALSAIDTRLTAARTNLTALQTNGAPEADIKGAQDTISRLEKQADTQGEFLTRTAMRAHGVKAPMPFEPDPTKRKVNGVYDNGYGTLGKWNGKGWDTLTAAEAKAAAADTGTGKPTLINPKVEEPKPTFDSVKDWYAARDKAVADAKKQGGTPDEQRILASDALQTFARDNPLVTKDMAKWQNGYNALAEDAKKEAGSPDAQRVLLRAKRAKYVKDNPYPSR
jgi:hypothetical protein